MNVRAPIASLLLCLFLLGASSPAEEASSPAEQAVDPGGPDHVSVTMGANTAAVSAGSSFRLSFRFRLSPHWHIYWKNPGDNGAPTRIAVTAPAGFEVGAILFPRPAILVEPDATTYVYEDDVVLSVPVRAPAELPAPEDGAPFVFSAQVEWLVCKSVCMFGSAERELSIPWAATKEESEPVADALASTLNLPMPLAELPGASARLDAERTHLVISVPLPAARFIPDERPGVTYRAALPSTEGEVTTLVVPITLQPKNALGKQMVVAGLILAGELRSDPCYEFAIPVPE